jgi:hypothetical protein
MTRDRMPQDRDPSILLAEVLAGLGRLVKGEVALARAEVKEGLHNLSAELAKIILAVVLAIVALNVLASAAVAALMTAGVSAGPAGLMVGLGLLGVAIAFARSARTKLQMQGWIPGRALRGLGMDAQAIREGLAKKGAQHG